MPELRFEKKEVVKLIILNNKNIVLKILNLSIGTSNSATISPKDILSEPIKMKANRIILVHNHPSRRFKT
jgi:DNA repair protein RadC